MPLTTSSMSSRVPDAKASRTDNLQTRVCSCKLFRDLGDQCPHACSDTLHAGVDIPSLCIVERMIGSLLMVYDTGIVPVDIDNVPFHVLEPPLVQRQAGRPKVNRIGPQHEVRPTRINHCSAYIERGHNETYPKNLNRVFLMFCLTRHIETNHESRIA